MRIFRFVRKRINFRAKGNKFLCGRKIIFVRKKINFCAEENKFSFGRKIIFVRRKIDFRAEENSLLRAEVISQKLFVVSQLSVVSVEGAVSLRERADTFAVSVDPFLVCLSQFGLKLISESILSVCPYL